MRCHIAITVSIFMHLYWLYIYVTQCPSHTDAQMKHISSAKVPRDCVSTTIEHKCMNSTHFRILLPQLKGKNYLVWGVYKGGCKTCWLSSGCRSSGCRSSGQINGGSSQVPCRVV